MESLGREEKHWCNGNGRRRRATSLIASPKVNRVVAVSRKPLSVQHPKLETVIEADMFRLRHLDALRDFDACFFCLGASQVTIPRRVFVPRVPMVVRQTPPKFRDWLPPAQALVDPPQGRFQNRLESLLEQGAHQAEGEPNRCGVPLASPKRLAFSISTKNNWLV
jgi:hypothetical protein